ncbi:MAG TPA: PQQ-binding-like beta-propeller repeat protein [Terriglobia bacterium]|jgi:quinoprotein glucose dehydrogenase
MRRSVFVVLSLLLAAATIVAQQGAKNGEWRTWGGDGGNTRYSPLDQINAQNVKNLKIAWVWKSDNFGAAPEMKNENTPLMVNGVLYFAAGDRRAVIAADPATGETLWVYRYPEPTDRITGVRKNNRGLAYWSDGRQSKILTVTPGYELIALDARTGQPDAVFGNKGIVDLTEQLEKDANFNPSVAHLMNTSPPLVFGNVAIIPTALENARVVKSMKATKADMLAFDVRTGKKLWSFHTIPRNGEFGEETWLNGSNIYTGHTGAWAPFTVDEQLGYVYIPVEGATGDQYGGQRPGNNLFSSSIVCLDIKTGKRIWHYQLTHHDIWDYDMPTAPILADITVNGRPVKAVVQLTKQAFAFVFDRTNGQPVFPIEERPVPQSDAPGEKTSPTQPFPIKPAAVDRQGMSESDLIDFTPQLKQMALDAVKGFRLGPMFTPPSVVDPAKGTKGTLTFPGSGGVDWEGGALDPETGFLYVGSATRTDTAVYGLQKPNPGETDIEMTGTASVAPTIQRLPIVKPPWTRITAINLNTGDTLWQVPNGGTPEWVTNHPLLKGVKLPQTGSVGRAPLLMATKTLLFAGSGYETEPAFRAFDKKTGALIWETQTQPGPPTGVPMTYIYKGKQYVVVAVEGNAATRTASALVAYTLP